VARPWVNSSCLLAGKGVRGSTTRPVTTHHVPMQRSWAVGHYAGHKPVVVGQQPPRLAHGPEAPVLGVEQQGQGRGQARVGAGKLQDRVWWVRVGWSGFHHFPHVVVLISKCHSEAQGRATSVQSAGITPGSSSNTLAGRRVRTATAHSQDHV
jgi:hypothetical protein